MPIKETTAPCFKNARYSLLETKGSWTSICCYGPSSPLVLLTICHKAPVATEWESKHQYEWAMQDMQSAYIRPFQRMANMYTWCVYAFLGVCINQWINNKNIIHIMYVPVRIYVYYIYIPPPSPKPLWKRRPHQSEPEVCDQDSGG